jgi:transmembrane sensor
MTELSMRDAGQARTEAADWQARLGRDRSAGTRREFEAWLAADPAHATAFGLVEEIWSDLPGLRAALGEAPAATPFRRPAPRRPYAQVGMALAAGLACVAIGLEVYPRVAPQSFVTGHGERRTVALSDGSTLTLNTDTEAAVSYSLLQRRVALRKGEAVFDVKKGQRRPFVVAAGPQQVRAVGTSFLVRDDARAVQVVLFEGRVAITGGAAGKVMLDPGQGWTAAGGKAVLAPGALQAAGAWRRGEIVFEDAPIAQAVAEMNRYGARPILIAAGVDQGLRVTGIFRTGQSPAFARSIAAIYGLEARETADGVTLAQPRRP